MKKCDLRPLLGSLAVLTVALAASLAGGCAFQSDGRVEAHARRRTPPRRIISLAPSVTEILFALGAGPQVVADTNQCNFPPAARALPHIGDVHLDYERIVGLAPDLVVAESITPVEARQRLAALDLDTLSVDSSTLDGYERSLDALGRVTGHTERAQALIAALHAEVDRLQQRRRGLRHHARVFVEIWDRPLQTVGRGTFIDQMITLAGGVNIFSDLEGYPLINPEAVLRRNPDVVLLTTSTPASFAAMPSFDGLTAVRNNAVHAVNPDTFTRPGPRLIEALEALTRRLGP